MANFTISHAFSPGTTIRSNEVNINFNTIAQFLNGQVMHRDATTAFTAIPTLPASDPTSPNHAVRKAYVDANKPFGGVHSGRTDGSYATVTFNHNMGRRPQAVVACPALPASGSSQVWWFLGGVTFTDTEITVQARNSEGAPFTHRDIAIRWIAI